MALKLDIDSLQTLKAISDSGSITKAADTLALSQSAVSHKVRRLEEKIDRPLLNRGAGSGTFTEDGERLLAYAERILDLHQEALSSIGLSDLKGRVRIGTTEDVTSSSIARILGGFTRRYPAVEVKVQVEQSLTLIRRLNAKQIDVAVMQVFESDVIKSDTVIRIEPLCWVSALGKQYENRSSIPFVAFHKNCLYRNWALDCAQAHNVDLRTVLECPSIEGVSSAVTAGLGVSILNQGNIRPGMRYIDINLPNPPPVAYVIRAQDSVNKNLIEALTDNILMENRRDAG